MLFNSVEFLFVFLPVLLVVFFRLARRDKQRAALWLTAGSLVFYGWWNPIYVALLLASIVGNYLIGRGLARGDDVGSTRRKRLLFVGVAADLAVLAYFKYANFFIDSVNASLHTQWAFAGVVLPLGISFFTFTQIAFLVDAARGEAKEFNFIHYCLFVTYFPHLIAGPVLHHKEMMPQFANDRTYRASVEFITVGLTMFALGLFKKVVLADGIAPFAAPVFAAAEHGDSLAAVQAWGGALAYTLQLYFDFSGYSDMAIGLSYLIGVRLPINFASPYKSVSITEFWRRWHMTLSRFLRDYLYIPLGGNRRGNVQRYVNLMATMVLGGLWHGAGWTFVVWGALHGVYLIVHHAWQALRRRLGDKAAHDTAAVRLLATALTFVAVVVGWVFFRAHTIAGAGAMLRAMAGANGVTLPDILSAREPWLVGLLAPLGITFTPGGGRDFLMTWTWVGALLCIVFLAPNTQQLMARFDPTLDGGVRRPPTRWTWIPVRWQAIGMALVLAGGLLSLTRPSEFLYFQF